MRRLLLVFLTLGLIAQAQAAEMRDPYQYFFNETFGDFTEEAQRARDEGKKGILIFFEMDECPFCHWMKENVLNRPDVQAYYREHFLSFPVDIEGDIEVTTFEGEVMPQKDFAFKKNRVRATPVFVFFDLDGERVHRFTGRTRNAEEFMLLGRYVAEERFKETSFTRFKRQHR